MPYCLQYVRLTVKTYNNNNQKKKIKKETKFTANVQGKNKNKKNTSKHTEVSQRKPCNGRLENNERVIPDRPVDETHRQKSLYFLIVFLYNKCSKSRTLSCVPLKAVHL